MTPQHDSLKTWGVVTLILTTAAILYGHTLHAPFYLDDQWAIIDNYLLRDLPATWGKVFSQRGLSNLSFALNYRLTGLSLPALHLTNLALHVGCGLLVWRLLLKLVRQPWLALLGSLLFIAHPLQTQAVTYLVQRATVLGALFFLLAMHGHLAARQALAAGAERNQPRHLLPWLSAIFFGACAVLAKENTSTLVLVLIVYDWLFPFSVKRSLRQKFLDYLPFALAPLLLGGLMLGGASRANPIFPLASMEGSTPLTYLVTEFSVFWVYLRLLFIPYGQALEHNYPVVVQLLTVQNVLALAGLLTLVWFFWRLRRSRPLLVFGAAWFMLALAVESSIIPLDPLFEHRLYLPMFGFVLIVIDGLAVLLKEKRAAIILGSIVLICLPLTWQRNALWRDPIRLYEDNLRQVPGSERASETLAILYARAGRYDDERNLLEQTLRQYPHNYILYINLAKTYMEEGRSDDAFALLEVGIQALPENPKLYETAAELAQREGDSQRARHYLQRGLAVPGADRSILLNDLGVLYASRGESLLAEQAFLDSLIENEIAPVTHLNLGKEYYAQQSWLKAMQSFRRAQRLEPGNPQTLEGLGRSALQLGDVSTAQWAAEKLRYADRHAGLRLQAAIISRKSQL